MKASSLLVLAALAAVGCTHASAAPPPAQESEQLRRLMADMATLARRVCEQQCEREVLGKCVERAVEAEIEEDCPHQKALACLMNCAP